MTLIPRHARLAAVLGLAASLAFTPVVAAPEPAPTDAQLISRFLDDSLHGSNLRLRLLFGTVQRWSNDASFRHTATSIDVLAEQARGSTDPMVLALLLASCGYAGSRPKPACDPLEIATRWTIAETQNQIAWLGLASVLRARGEAAAARAAFVKASEGSTWHEYHDEGARVIAHAIPASLSLPARLQALKVALSLPDAQLVATSAIQTVLHFCKDPTLRAACVRIVDTMVRDGGSIVSSHFANRVGEQMAIDGNILAMRKQAIASLRWASMWALPADADGAGTPEVAASIELLERRIALGEVPWLRSRLIESGLSESDAAARYLADRPR